ncbi:MAG: MBL fold metallo-hydrolase [Tannerella sp.]|jgi:glyoxylase-like metal-dependent hydrolase (beta-lactamase superfamily II)|nr:MBL fold metallo-hydrolase [Tannerella sp.]
MINVKIFEFNFVYENTYLLYDETNEAVIIDCGCMSAAEEETLSGFIAEHQLIVKRLLCTHLHFDHILGNRYVYQTYGVKPEAHRKDVEIIPPLNKQIPRRDVQSVQAIDVEDFIEENETICFGRSELTTLLVPGHSPGSLAYYSAKDGFIIVGDALFRCCIGRTDLWGGDYDTLITSIRTKILSLPDKTIVYPGHGPATTVIQEKRDNPYLL